MLAAMSNAPPIVVERTLKAPPKRVWRAITDEAEMPRWFFEPIRSFKPELGFETKFNVHSGGRDFVHHWRVTEVSQDQRLVYDWLYPDFPGASFVVWELSPAGEGTRLRLTHTGVATFPQDVPEFSRESCSGGWEYFFDRLGRFVETGTP
jgi:uncharacterized protein YndB with AHSA1/START domain